MKLNFMHGVINSGRLTWIFVEAIFVVSPFLMISNQLCHHAIHRVTVICALYQVASI